jgi:hypothetical protein
VSKEVWPSYYILIDKVPVAVDLKTWDTWFEKTQTSGDTRRVNQTVVNKRCSVSTVFLGLDHNFSGTGDPILFETMVFGGPLDGGMRRCSTWKQAEAMHDAAVAEVQAACVKVERIAADAGADHGGKDDD